MRWFHTVALPLATMIAIYFGVTRKAPFWKHGALVLGCGVMLGGLWLAAEWSTLLLIGGGVVFFLGRPRGLVVRPTGVSIDRAPARIAGELRAGGIHISFPSPRFFMGDAQVVLLLDGTTIFEGGFKAGIDVTVAAPPGQHRLGSVIDLGIAKRRRVWEVAVPPAGCDVLLEYSRFWGNFAKDVRIGSAATAGPSAGVA